MLYSDEWYQASDFATNLAIEKAIEPQNITAVLGFNEPVTRRRLT